MYNALVMQPCCAAGLFLIIAASTSLILEANINLGDAAWVDAVGVLTDCAAALALDCAKLTVVAAIMQQNNTKRFIEFIFFKVKNGFIKLLIIL
jgi:hypothetical protein